MKTQRSYDKSIVECNNVLINKKTISGCYVDNIEKAYGDKLSRGQKLDLVYRTESDAWMSLESREIQQEFVAHLANAGGVQQ